jgi:hypothetical protein
MDAIPKIRFSPSKIPPASKTNITNIPSRATEGHLR